VRDAGSCSGGALDIRRSIEWPDQLPSKVQLRQLMKTKMADSLDPHSPGLGAPQLLDPTDEWNIWNRAVGKHHYIRLRRDNRTMGQRTHSHLDHPAHDPSQHGQVLDIDLVQARNHTETWLHSR